MFFKIIYMLQWVEFRTDLIKVLFIFYLLIYSGQIHNTFTCLKINNVTNNIVVKYILIFFIFYFLVTYVSNTQGVTHLSPIQKLLVTIFYYFIFLIILKINNVLRNVILALFGICYFMDINRDYFEVVFKDNSKEVTYMIQTKSLKLFPVKRQHILYINNTIYTLLIIIAVLMVIGLIRYLLEVRYLMSKNLKLFDILFYNVCTIKDAKTLKKISFENNHF